MQILTFCTQWLEKAFSKAFWTVNCWVPWGNLPFQLKDNTTLHTKTLAISGTQTPAGIGLTPNFVGAGTLGQTAFISNAVKFSATVLSPSSLQSSHFTTAPLRSAANVRPCSRLHSIHQQTRGPGGGKRERTDERPARWAMMWKNTELWISSLLEKMKKQRVSKLKV